MIDFNTIITAEPPITFDILEELRTKLDKTDYQAKQREYQRWLREQRKADRSLI